MTPRWVERTLYFARCATCEHAIPKGARAWYDPRMPKGKKMKCEAHAPADADAIDPPANAESMRPFVFGEFAVA